MKFILRFVKHVFICGEISLFNKLTVLGLRGILKLSRQITPHLVTKQFKIHLHFQGPGLQSTSA